MAGCLPLFTEKLVLRQGNLLLKYKKAIFLIIPFYLASCSPTHSPVTVEEQKADAGLKKVFNVEEIDERVMQIHMDRVDAYVKWLDAAIKKKNWDKIMLYTKHVDSLGELLLSANINTNSIPQEFFEIDRKFKESIDYIIEAAEQKDAKATRIEFKRFLETCEQCHAKYKRQG